MRSGERQVAPTLDGIRRDHVARYQWAARTLPPGSGVVDVACGVGYGSWLLAEAGHSVHAIDIDAEAVAYAREHYAHERVRYAVADASSPIWATYDAAVCFEAIEHMADPLPMLRALASTAPLLLASVPNERFFPFRGYAYHHRHYTERDLHELLDRAGFRAVEVLGQQGAESDVGRVWGRTIVIRAERTQGESMTEVASAPAHVALVGLGPSCDAYLNIARNMGGRSAYCDEVWAINALGDVLACDRIFHMDDVRVQEMRAAAAPGSNIAKMLAWLKRHPGPVYTSFTHPDYPGLVAFPLEDVINNLGFAYLNNTAAFAVAYAIHIGVKKLSLFGCDFTYPDAHHAERGRACVEYWLGYARARGVEITTAARSSLLDAIVPWREKVYGYDFVDIQIAPRTDSPGFAVTFKDRETPPTVDEIETRYDHGAHPNPLVAE